MNENPYAVGSRVVVLATGAVGTVVEVSRKDRWVDVDLGDGITVEFNWDEIEPMPVPGGSAPRGQA